MIRPTLKNAPFLAMLFLLTALLLTPSAFAFDLQDDANPITANDDSDESDDLEEDYHSMIG